MASAVPGLFVAGTDTDVGKTIVAAAIIRDLRAAGHTVGPYKPVASGGDADARALWEAAGRPLRQAAVCPQWFLTPLAPHHAAREEGRRVDAGLLVAGLAPWLDHCGVVVVEGAGGLFSPLTDELLNADLATRFGLPVVVVDGGRLGCVGRVLATCAAAATRGLRVAAVVVSQSVADDGRDGDPTAPRRIAADGAAEIRRWRPDLPVTLLPHGAPAPTPAIDWMAAARGHTGTVRDGSGR